MSKESVRNREIYREEKESKKILMEQAKKAQKKSYFVLLRNKN